MTETERAKVLHALVTHGPQGVQQLGPHTGMPTKKASNHIANLHKQHAVRPVALLPGKGRGRVWDITAEGRAILENPGVRRGPKRKSGGPTDTASEANMALSRLFQRERMRLERAGCSEHFIRLHVGAMRESIGHALAATLPATRAGLD